MTYIDTPYGRAKNENSEIGKKKQISETDYNAFYKKKMI